MPSLLNSLNSALSFKKIKSAFQILQDCQFYSKSFSQFGEDLIVNQILTLAGENNYSYLDVGANHPCYLNNTYLLYKKGGSGVLVEPDPILCKALRSKRPRDKVINCGLGFSQSIEKATLYRMNTSVLNTFSKEEAVSIERQSQYHVVDEIDIDLIPINLFFEKYLDFTPAFFSIDVEGFDFQIMKNLDFSKYRPLAISIETLTFDPINGGKKITPILDLMFRNNYSVFADTRCNTIFVDTERFMFT